MATFGNFFGLDILVILLVLAGPIVGAFLFDNRHRRLRPKCLGYVWGYFNALFLLIMAAGTGAGILPSPDIVEAAVRGVFFCVFLLSGILILRRNRWAFLLIVIASMNPVSWLIGGIYLKNRWQEMGAAPAPKDSWLPAAEPLLAAAPPPTVEPAQIPPVVPQQFKFPCPQCGQRIAALLEDAGTVGGCPSCQSAFTVPSFHA